MLRRHLVSTALVAGLSALAAGPVSPAAAKPLPSCAKKKGEIKRTSGGVLWSVKGVLWGCTAFYGDPPETYRLGPWSKASRYAFDGGTVAWTVPKTGKHGTEDAVWTAKVTNGAVGLRGVRPTTGPGSSTDVRVARLVAKENATAWVTLRGTVVAALGADETPEAVGASDGLATPFVQKGGRYVVGRWPDVAGTAFAKTLTIEVGDGEGDECGGTNPYSVTVRPVDGEPPVGLTAFVGWVSSSNACNG